MSELESSAVNENDSAGDDSPLYGVSFRQFAAIRAALAEGFTLEQVLQKERVDEYDWRRAEVKWEKRVTSYRTLAERNALEMAAAEDWLWRDVTPIQDDVAAWAAFYAAYSAAPQKDQWLAQRMLTRNDISRLIRRWSRRAAEDSSIERQLSQLPAKAEAPRVTAAPKVLKRKRPRTEPITLPSVPKAIEGRQDALPAPSTPDELDVFVFGIDRYAALCAELEVFPREVARIHDKYNLESEADYNKLAERMKEHLAKDAEHARDYRRQHQLALARAKKLAETTTAEERAEATRKQNEPEALKPSFQEQNKIELGDYYSPPADLAAKAESVAAPAVNPVAEPQKAIAGATQDVSALLESISSPALPFAASDPNVTADEAVARIEKIASAENKPAPPAALPGGTMDVDALLAKTDLPAQWKAPELARSEAPKKTESPIAPPRIVEVEKKPAAPPKEASGTMDVDALIAKTDLPAQWKAPEPARSEAPKNPEPPIEKPPQRPVTRPPEQRPAAVAAAQTKNALPELSVEQYAYLCIELEVRPDRLQETLTRYGLSAESLDTVHAVWRQRLAFDSTAKETFARISWDYKIWLAGQSRAVPRLTIEQYASLVVDLSRSPAQRTHILQRYQLDEAAKATLDSTFKRQFDSDPRARATFDQATATYSAWLAGRSG